MNRKAGISRDAIVDAALELADADHWERVRLHDVAARLGCSLDDIRAHFAEKESIVDAWFDRADAAMLNMGSESGTDSDPFMERVEAWLAALAPYRRVTREMILTRLEPGHVHHQFPMLLRVSRTVQWMREAAGLQESFVARAFAETVCTARFLRRFARWLGVDACPRARAFFGWTH